jgi:putative toxin-antitoxin system antitoxin component (TIGR02293 family)
MATTIGTQGTRKTKLPKASRRVGKRKISDTTQTRRKAARGSYDLLGLKAASALDLIGHVERGLTFNSVEQLRQKMGIPMKAMAELLQIKSRTLLRRREEGRLHADESDRLLRALRLFSRTVDLFEGNEAAARRWLLAPQRALGGAVPLEIARSEVGAREVEQIIGRLEHGVFT